MVACVEPSAIRLSRGHVADVRAVEAVIGGVIVAEEAVELKAGD